MPYIEEKDKPIARIAPQTPGELTFKLTETVLSYLYPHSDTRTPRYADFAEVLGALEATKLELYRRAIAPYEDKKIAENGDVYPA